MPQTKKYLIYLIYFLILNGIFNHLFFRGNDVMGPVADAFTFYIFIRIWAQKYKVVNDKLLLTIPSTLLLFVAAFFIIGSVSSVIFENKLITCIWGMHFYVRYLLLFYSAYKLFNREDIQKVKQIFMKMLKLNAYFVPFQVYVFGMQGDVLGGTVFGGNSAFLNFLLPCLYFFIMDYFRGKYKTIHLIGLILCVMLFAKWGEVKAIYFILPALLLACYVVYHKVSTSYIIGVIMFVVLVIPVSEFVLTMYMDEYYVDRVFNMDYVEAETSNTVGWGGFNRSTCVELTNRDVLVDPPSMAIGYGFGQANTSQSLGGFVGEKFGANGLHLFTSSYVLSEVGWAGYICFLAVYVMLLIQFWIYQKKYSDDKEIRYWASIGIISVLFNFVIIWYNCTPVTSGYFTTILWAMCFLSIRFRIDELVASKVDLRYRAIKLNDEKIGRKI